MSQENVELVRGLQPSPETDLVPLFRNDAAAAALMEAVSPFFHVDVEIIGPTFVAGGGVRFVGLEGFRAGWLDWLEPWESYRVEIEDVVDKGDDALVLVRDYGRRAGTTGEVSVVGAAVWTVREGKVARVAFYLDRSEALKAVGLSE